MPEGPYTGRLAFDPDTELHLADTWDHRAPTDAEIEGRVAWLIALEDGKLVPLELAHEIAARTPVEEPHKVVTDDHGKTWRYATESDTSHNSRYHQASKVVTQTVDWAVGPDGVPVKRAGDEHHYQAQPGDPHYELGATNSKGIVTNTRVQFLPDDVAAKATSHTEAYA